jgi:hypothetical protein
MKNIFTEHPHSINETYLQHMRFAAINGVKLILAGLAAIIHSIFPFLFTTKASKIAMSFINILTDRLVVIDDDLKRLAEKIKAKEKK